MDIHLATISQVLADLYRLMQALLSEAPQQTNSLKKNSRDSTLTSGTTQDNFI